MFAIFSYLTSSYPEGGPDFLATRSTEEKAYLRCEELAAEMVAKYHTDPISSTYGPGDEERHTYAPIGRFQLEEMKEHPFYGRCWGIRDTEDPHEGEPMMYFYIKPVADHE